MDQELENNNGVDTIEMMFLHGDIQVLDVSSQPD